MAQYSPLFAAYEVQHSLVENYANVGDSVPNLRVKVAVDANLSYSFIQDMLGTPRIYPTSAGGATYLKAFDMVCVSAVKTPDGGKFTTSDNPNQSEIANTVWHFVDLVFTYRKGSYKSATLPTIDVGGYIGQLKYYVEDSIKPRIERRPASNDKLIWESDQSPVRADEGPHVNIPGSTLLHRVEGYLSEYTFFTDLIGTVATQGYTSTEGRVYAPKTLLLRNVEVSPTITHNSFQGERFGNPTPDAGVGKHTFAVNFLYEFKQEGWDQFYRLKVGATYGWQLDGIRLQKDGTTVVRPYFDQKSHGAILF